MTDNRNGRPPEISWSGRLRRKFFYSPFACVVTLGLALMVAAVCASLVQWAIVHAVWAPDLAACRAADAGACWGFVSEKWRLILFGRFPYELQWRAAAATSIVIAMALVTAWPKLWSRGGVKLLLLGWTGVMAAFFGLMAGGFAGLPAVGSDLWGGLPLTIILTLVGMALSSPIGILLAIGRRSSLPLIRVLCTAYIELVRGVPLITVLFVASFVFPLLLPSWLQVDAFWRVLTAIILFQAAYMAETVRGGLQTVPSSQSDAAASLGLTKAQSYAYVILPQALAAIIPAFVNSLISCFLDTSLVTIVSMYDLTGALRLALGDAQWRAFFIEGYVFIAVIYFSAAFLISRYSQWVERRIKGGRRR